MLPGADRYSALLPPRVRETSPLLHAPPRWTEMELQAHWFAGDFGRDFQTSAGVPVRVVQFGVWNREAGPDFVEAAVSFNGEEAVRGAIEFDPDVRDWERHGHASNPDYEGVVLHVFTEVGTAEFFTRTASHRNVPQVKLNLATLTGDVPNPLPEAAMGRCCAPLRALPDALVRKVLLGAAGHRLRRKAAALARLSELHGPDEALYQALAAALGYKRNKLPFTLLAQRLPLQLLMKAKGDVEALLFGVSGFLPATDLGAFDATTRDYLRGLWEKWWPRRSEFARMVIAPEAWQLSGQRPVNHPQRRLAALAAIVRAWPKVRTLRENCKLGPITDFFAALHDPYWEHHYTVSSKASAKPMALVGESRAVDILVNVFLPLAFPSSQDAQITALQKLRTPLLNRRIEIAATRLFGPDRAAHTSLLRSAAMQQGLMQIYEDFCMHDASDCAACRFPEQLGRW